MVYGRAGKTTLRCRPQELQPISLNLKPVPSSKQSCAQIVVSGVQQLVAPQHNACPGDHDPRDPRTHLQGSAYVVSCGQAGNVYVRIERLVHSHVVYDVSVARRRDDEQTTTLNKKANYIYIFFC